MKISCTCTPEWMFHQYHCALSRRMRAELREARMPVKPIDPQERARVR